jgi:hypothetical protein
VRIYPVPFRRLDEAEQYRKFDWVECRLTPARGDPRPESKNPFDITELVAKGHMDTADYWRERRRLLLGKAKVYSNLSELIAGARENRMSLAVFKPTKIVGFIHEDEDREWNADKVAELRARANQVDMFDEESWRKTFKLIPKLPYSFSYQFEDDEGKRSELQVLDWEIGALYNNCLRTADSEVQALSKVRQKYLIDFLKTDLHFFLGTTQQWHQVATNPWVIIGVFPIPHEVQSSLF